jgi:iron(III) transport system ATP-binding protein
LGSESAHRDDRAGSDGASTGVRMTDLRVSDLHKSYGGVAALRGVDLVVPTGSFTAVLGPSGSGKTTLLRVIAGFERADRGTVSLGGLVVEDDHHHEPPERRRVGYVPQEGALFPHLTVEKNVGFGVAGRDGRRQRVGELLELVGLGGLGPRYPHQLSGGQQQRVALARALAVSPQMILLDEPFAALDARLRASVRAEVLEVLQRAGTTSVFVTHDQDEALSMADQVAVLGGGRVQQVGTPRQLYAHPGDPGVARFLGSANLIAGTFAGRAVRTALGDLELDSSDPGHNGHGAGASSGPAVVLVRPEQLELGSPDGAVLVVQVVQSEYFGHDATVTVRPAAESPDLGFETLVVRITGGADWPRGAQAGLAVRGRVLAWPPPGDALGEWGPVGRHPAGQITRM